MVIGKIFTFIIVAILLYSIAYYGFNTTANPSVSLEVRNFTANNTYYDLGYTPITLSSYHLYYFENTTFEIPSSLYGVTTTQVRIYANGTGSYPNVTTNANYYSSYTYVPQLTVWGSSYNFILGLIVIICIGVILLQLWRQTKSK